jgi:hypothetical protein
MHHGVVSLKVRFYVRVCVRGDLDETLQLVRRYCHHGQGNVEFVEGHEALGQTCMLSLQCLSNCKRLFQHVSPKTDCARCAHPPGHAGGTRGLLYAH